MLAMKPGLLCKKLSGNSSKDYYSKACPPWDANPTSTIFHWVAMMCAGSCMLKNMHNMAKDWPAQWQILNKRENIHSWASVMITQGGPPREKRTCPEGWGEWPHHLTSTFHPPESQHEINPEVSVYEEVTYDQTSNIYVPTVPLESMGGTICTATIMYSRRIYSRYMKYTDSKMYQHDHKFYTHTLHTGCTYRLYRYSHTTTPTPIYHQTSQISPLMGSL